MALDRKDLELIEQLIYKTSDDFAVSFARAFERLEERIDAAEGRLHSRIADIEDKLDSRASENLDPIEE